MKHKHLPKKLISKSNVWLLTKYGSYVHEKDDGMVREKNATSYKELIRLGYKPIKG